MSTIPKVVLETFPKKIYLQTTDEDECEPYPKGSGEVTWCSDRMHTSDVEYVRADLATDGREELEKKLAYIKDTLDDCREYMDDKADVDVDNDYFAPNKEAKLLSRIDSTIEKLNKHYGTRH